MAVAAGLSGFSWESVNRKKRESDSENTPGNLCETEDDDGPCERRDLFLNLNHLEIPDAGVVNIYTCSGTCNNSLNLSPELRTEVCRLKMIREECDMCVPIRYEPLSVVRNTTHDSHSVNDAIPNAVVAECGCQKK